MLMIATVAVLVAAGSFSISFNWPTAWAPLPFAVALPMIWAVEVFRGVLPTRWIVLLMSSLAGPVFLFSWYPGLLLEGSSEVPRRTFIGLAVLSAMTVWWFVEGWGWGVQYQGRPYVVAVACTNVAALAACWAIVIYARRTVSFEATFIAHASVALWLTWMAFPWLGEML